MVKHKEDLSSLLYHQTGSPSCQKLVHLVNEDSKKLKKTMNMLMIITKITKRMIVGTEQKTENKKG